MTVKVLVYSNAAFASTGYGIQTRHLCAMFRGIGHEVAVAANWGLTGAAIYWGDIPHFPTRNDPYGFDVLPYYAEWWGADVVLTLYDPWAFPPDFRQRINRPWICYTPLDGTPAPEGLVRKLRTADYVVTYSRFAQEAFEMAGLPSEYIPHCIDTDIFKPGDKAAVRESLGIDQDVFMASVVAMNKDRIPSRKSWPEILEAWARFQRNRNNAMLYCHTTKRPLAAESGGFYFDGLIQQLKIPQSAIGFPDPQAFAVGVDDENMALIYQASDVVLLPSMAEGFGLPIIEAQACGVPVITIKAHTGPELTNYGILTKPAGKTWIPGRDYYWAQADILEIAAALNVAYMDCKEDGRLIHGNAPGAVHWVNENYSFASVGPQWSDFLGHVEAGLW